MRTRHQAMIAPIFAALLFLLTAGRVCAADNAQRRAGQSAPADEATIVMVGDMLMHTPVVKSGLRADGSYNFDHLFAHVRKEIAGADVAIVNQETILGDGSLGAYSGYPAFYSPCAVGDAEVAAGFDVILQGTNHALDKSARGIERCLDFWENAYPALPVLGIHDSAGDQKEICYLTVKGMRIAVLNYTYGTNGIQMPEGKEYLVDYLSERRVRADIARAEEEADFTIVCPHWGTEYRLTADADQKKWAQIFFDCGVDLVLGAHPHVIEPIETLCDESGRQMPVYYSLGNFVNATSGTGAGIMNRAVGGMARVTIGRDADGIVRVRRAQIEPLVCHDTAETVTAYFLSDYTEELARENRFAKRDPAFSLAACRALVDAVWPQAQTSEAK